MTIRPSRSAIHRLMMPALAGVALALSACAGGGEASDEPGQDGAQVALAPDPCVLLDNAFLAARFEMTGAEVTRTPGNEYVAHPLCTARWPKPNAAEIEARQAAEAGARVIAKIRGEQLAPLERTHNEVSLMILTERAESPEGAIAGFDQAMAMIAEGTALQGTVEPISGLADKAAWIKELLELAVVSGRQRFSVTVRADADPAANREHAMAFARTLSRTLR